MDIFIDKKGYPRYRKNGKLVHRSMAYKYIYLKNMGKYPLPFRKYIVHHKDGNKRNYHSSNLEILTPTEHRTTHGIINVERFVDYIELFRNEDDRRNLSRIFGYFLLIAGVLSLLFQPNYFINFIVIIIGLFLIRKKKKKKPNNKKRRIWRLIFGYYLLFAVVANIFSPFERNMLFYVTIFIMLIGGLYLVTKK